VKGDDINNLALLGGKAQFSDPLNVGQMNLPKRRNFEKAFRDIFTRRYYTNHGPLTQELENRLSAFFDVRNVVTMTNGTIARMLVAKSLNLRGKVIVPAFTLPAMVQSLTWAGAEPLFCDVDPHTHLLTPELAKPLLDEPNVRAILPIHLWGNLCPTDALEELARRKGIPVYYDAAHAFGCSRNGKKAGCHGVLEIFSFHATNVFNTAEGGCVSTNDDDIAEQLRNLRSSYGRRKSVKIPINGNGRFSEAQAAMGLLCLENYPSIVDANKAKFELYTKLLGNIPGIRILQPVAGEKCNYQSVVLEVDSKDFGLTKNQLVRLLEAENIHIQQHFVSGMHRYMPYKESCLHKIDTFPTTDMLCDRVIQLCSGQSVSLQDACTICELITFIHNNAASLHVRLPEGEL
jgi:dTDP-4-amino-4,6-dideoxygalactose transaminase